MRIPKNFEDRTAFVKDQLLEADTDYSAIAPVHNQDQVSHNIENFIGDIKIPLGLAGPLNIRGKNATGTFYAPMATTEGALVASYSRGMRIMNECGGCETTTTDDYFVRAGLLVTRSLKQAGKLQEWCSAHESEIIDLIQKGSRFCRVKEIDYQLVSSNLLVSFKLDTGDAMGSNMGSKASFVATEFIHTHSNLSEHYYAPLPEDKKAIPGRTKGKKVIARCQIDGEILKRITRANAQSVFEFTNLYKNTLASFGCPSLNIHSANGLTALFLALGQDPAYIPECSQGISDMSPLGEDQWEVSLTLPSLIVGSVGGGTGLPSAKACLNMIDCYGAGKAKKLAEIMAATALAGEINTAAAECAHEFVEAHESMGKNPPKK